MTQKKGTQVGFQSNKHGSLLSLKSKEKTGMRKKRQPSGGRKHQKKDSRAGKYEKKRG